MPTNNEDAKNAPMKHPPQGFKWRGRNKQGVPVYVGTWDNLPLWFCHLFLTLAAFYGVAAVGAVVLSQSAEMSAALICGLMGIIYGGVTAWSYWFRNRLQSLTPADEVCARLGVDAQGLEQIAEARDIKPRYVVNGRTLYDAADFDRAATLLRATVAPGPAPETLLRPASSTPEIEGLLRAAGGPPQTAALSSGTHRRDTRPDAHHHTPHDTPQDLQQSVFTGS